ncbi:creatininase family protein [soil metagenome]
MNWAERTWSEISQDIEACNCAAILPIGATEQHGPHLGCGTDTLFADRVAARVGVLTNVPVLPVIPYGCSGGHSRRWPGTIALDPVLLINLVEQVGQWAYYSGVRKLFIVNSHVTNHAPLRCALEMLRSRNDDFLISLQHTFELSPRVRAAFNRDAADWHANQAETALLMAIEPAMVRPPLLATSDDPDRTGGLVFSHPVNRTSTNGVTGSPSKASVSDGREWFEWMVEDLAAIVRRGLVESPPLSHSFFGSVGCC